MASKFRVSPRFTTIRRSDNAWITLDNPTQYNSYTTEMVKGVIEKARWASCLIVKQGDRYFINNDRGDLIIAKLTPGWFHDLVANWARGYPPGEHEPWPTYYRLNSRRTVYAEGYKAGFKRIELRMWEPEPRYLVFHYLPFLVGVGYERIVNRYRMFEGIRAGIFGRMMK